MASGQWRPATHICLSAWAVSLLGTGLHVGPILSTGPSLGLAVDERSPLRLLEKSGCVPRWQYQQL